MIDLMLIEEEFKKKFFVLDNELIGYLLKDDNTGQLNNVVIGLSKECYGVRLFEEDKGLTIEIYYICYKLKLEGNLIRIELDHPNYSFLLLQFCSILALNFSEINEIHVFNTYQKQLRTILEKDGFFTITSVDIEKLKAYGTNGTFLNLHHKGIKVIDIIPIVDFYREIFEQNYKIISEDYKEYVYLMINIETALIKIGFSKDPKYREKTLQSQEPQVYLIACWRANRTIETFLHQKFRHKRKRGEYFRLGFLELKELKDSMQKYNTG